MLGNLQGSVIEVINKRPNPDIYLPLTKAAIERAKSSDNANEDYPKNIGTHIYKLIEKIII